MFAIALFSSMALMLVMLGTLSCKNYYQATVDSTNENGVTVTTSVNSLTEIDKTIAANTTNNSNPVSIAYANIVYIYICFDQNVTVKTNSTSAPDQTLTFLANIPYTWQTGTPGTMLFTANLTNLYITTTAETNAIIKIGI